MTVKIDKGIPITPQVGPKGNKGNRKYPWYEMEVGDSFFVPSTNPSRFMGSKYNYLRARGIEISCRAVTENGINGVRVWRVE